MDSNAHGFGIKLYLFFLSIYFPAHNANNVARFGPYQQAAITDFTRAGEITYPSIGHGSAMPESFSTPFLSYCSSFVLSARNTDSTTAITTLAAQLTQAIMANQSDFVKVLKLYQVPVCTSFVSRESSNVTT